MDRPDLVGSEQSARRTDLISRILPDDWGMLVSAFAASYGVGMLLLLGLPFAIGTTIDELGLSESKAGLLGTAEFIAIMIASLAAAPFMDRAPRRLLAFIGVALGVLGNVLSIALAELQFEQLMTYRVVAGLGCGFALAVGNATVSNAKNQEKLAGQMNILFAALTAITALLFSWAGENWGYRGSYGALAACMILVSPFLLKLPSRPASAMRNEAALDEATASGPQISIVSLGTLLLFAGMFLFSLRDMAGWAFVERIGVNTGYTSGQVGQLISFQAIIGVSGPFLASIIGSRFGLKIPLSLGLFSSGMIYVVMLLMPTSQAAYTIAAMFIAFTYFFTLAYLTAAAAKFDAKGRVVAASGGFLSAGMAFGSFVGGYSIESFGYDATAWVILAMMAASVVFVMTALQARKT